MVDNKEMDLKKFKLRLESNDVKKSLAPKFNIFDVLKIKRNEVLNSNVLAWLLNPKETHSLGVSFLDKFCRNVININQNIELSPNDDIQVYTEFNYIDIMVISHTSKLILIIENKIYTDEHDDQLDRYYKYIKSLNFENYEIQLYFLTLDKHEPKKEEDRKNWVAISHREILEIIETILEQKNDIEDDVRYFLYNFTKTLGELTMKDTDNENNELCDEIYCEFQKEIDYIISNKTKASSYLKAELDKDERIQHISLKNQGSYDVIRFVTTDLLKICKERIEKKNPWDTKHDFMVEVFCAPYPTKIKLTFQIRAMEKKDINKVKEKLEKICISETKNQMKIMTKHDENTDYWVIVEEKISLLPKDSLNEYINSIDCYVNKVKGFIFDEKEVQYVIAKLL